MPTDMLQVWRDALEAKIEADQHALEVATDAWLLICDELRKRAKKSPPRKVG